MTHSCRVALCLLLFLLLLLSLQFLNPSHDLLSHIIDVNCNDWLTKIVLLLDFECIEYQFFLIDLNFIIFYFYVGLDLEDAFFEFKSFLIRATNDIIDRLESIELTHLLKSLNRIKSVIFFILSKDCITA